VGASTDTAPLYRAADLFVQPSHFRSFGILGDRGDGERRAVVAAEVGGMRDFLADDLERCCTSPNRLSR
jgi:glycosyltransferase involved in cell wall biosynthesis